MSSHEPEQFYAAARFQMNYFGVGAKMLRQMMKTTTSLRSRR